MKPSQILCACALGLTLNTAIVHANGLIPAVKSGLYYQMGGGQDIPLPAFYDSSTIPLNVDGDVGLGFDCGAFNPAASLQNSLNQIKNSALNVQQQVLQNATAAITEFPLYELSRADPNLYNLLTSAMMGAREDMAVSTKSCQVMQSEIASGQNPYANWGQIALGQRWRQEIGTASLSGSGDINQARDAVSKDGGQSGIPWVNPDESLSMNGVATRYAGGKDQPPIHIVHDTAMAGYSVIVSGTRMSANDSNGSNGEPSELQTVFPNPKAAADWITQVVGDETITTYNRGPKHAQPGVGLQTDIERETKALVPKLQSLVSGSMPLTVENLKNLTASDMALSPEMIQAIQKQPKLIQGIMINKLAQNMAAMWVINKARLAMRILQSGGRIPAIYSNEAAQKNLQQALSLLQQSIQNILLFVKARQTLMSNFLNTVLQASQTEVLKNTTLASVKPNAPIMEQGAIAKA